MSLLPAAVRSRAASDRLFSDDTPVSMGFITPTSYPLVRKATASAAVTTVFPTPVSVPVIKTPCELEANDCRLVRVIA
jgi:hypothetical protein